jgi:hypothetical protein
MRTNTKIQLSDITLPGVIYLPSQARVYGVVARYNAPRLTIENSELSMADLLIAQLNLSFKKLHSGEGYYAHEPQQNNSAESYVLFADDEFYKNVMESVDWLPESLL